MSNARMRIRLGTRIVLIAGIVGLSALSIRSHWVMDSIVDQNNDSIQNFVIFPQGHFAFGRGELYFDIHEGIHWFADPPTPVFIGGGMDLLFFKYDRIHDLGGNTVLWAIEIPFWFLISILVIALALTMRWRKSRQPGTCPQCGYNLRATPDRCPECGQVFFK